MLFSFGNVTNDLQIAGAHHSNFVGFGYRYKQNLSVMA
jgi:hypothetical protein